MACIGQVLELAPDFDICNIIEKVTYGPNESFGILHCPPVLWHCVPMFSRTPVEFCSLLKFQTQRVVLDLTNSSLQKGLV
jgi:hypothetical protein